MMNICLKGLRKTTKDPSQDSWCRDRDLHREPSDHCLIQLRLRQFARCNNE
jgi:hypothetical protein